MKRSLVWLAAAAACLAFGLAAAQSAMLSAATVTGAGSAVTPTFGGAKQFQASGATSSGAGSVSVAVQCTVDGTSWDTLGTITLTLSTSPSSNSFTSNDRCRQVRGNVTAISGTGAAVSLFMGQ